MFREIVPELFEDRGVATRGQGQNCPGRQVGRGLQGGQQVVQSYCFKNNVGLFLRKIIVN